MFFVYLHGTRNEGFYAIDCLIYVSDSTLMIELPNFLTKLTIIFYVNILGLQTAGIVV